MNEKTEAIVLHSIKHSDTSTILHLLTEKFGHLAFAVSGIRGKRSRIKASMLMPLTLLEIDFNNNNKFDLQRISDAKLLRTFGAIPFDPARNAIAIFIAEVLHKTQREPNPDPAVFALVKETILKLDDPAIHIGNFHLIFLLRYAAALGFAPLADSYSNGLMFNIADGTFGASTSASNLMLDKEESAALNALCSLSYERGSDIAIGRQLKKKITLDLMDFFRLHTNERQEFKSLNVIYELF